jgi:hypothetical protein
MKSAFIIFFFTLGFLSLSPSEALCFQTLHREIDRTKEKELNVVIDVSFGNI